MHNGFKLYIHSIFQYIAIFRSECTTTKMALYSKQIHNNKNIIGKFTDSRLTATKFHKDYRISEQMTNLDLNRHMNILLRARFSSDLGYFVSLGPVQEQLRCKLHILVGKFHVFLLKCSKKKDIGWIESLTSAPVKCVDISETGWVHFPLPAVNNILKTTPSILLACPIWRKIRGDTEYQTF